MKKLVIISIVAALLLTLGVGFAQTNSPQSAAHGVNVAIPSLVMIRFTESGNNGAVSAPTPIEFMWDAATFPFEGSHGPTNDGPMNWGTVRVFANAAGWNLTVTTVQGATESRFDWANISVTPAAASPVLPFTLGDTTTLLSGQARTTGWLDLGFGPDQYALTLTGSEAPGTYSAVVTYTIANP